MTLSARAFERWWGGVASEEGTRGNVRWRREEREGKKTEGVVVGNSLPYLNVIG